MDVGEQQGVLEPWPGSATALTPSLTSTCIKGPSPPLIILESLGPLQLYFPISQMGGNRGPVWWGCLPTPGPPPPPHPPHLRLWWASGPVLTRCVSSGQLLTLSGAWFLHRRKGAGMGLFCGSWLTGRKGGDHGSPAGRLAETSSSLPPPPPPRGLPRG